MEGQRNFLHSKVDVDVESLRAENLKLKLQHNYTVDVLRDLLRIYLDTDENGLPLADMTDIQQVLAEAGEILQKQNNERIVTI